MSEAAPNGWIWDGRAKTWRPRKYKPRQPAVERPEDLERIERGEDRLPSSDKPRKQRVQAAAPRFRAGVIAKGMDRLYRKAGKLIGMQDPDVGAALIECTRKEWVQLKDPDGRMVIDQDGRPVMVEDPDDVTVGEAWEAIARSNAAVRRVLLQLIAGNDWMNLAMAHTPLVIALVSKDAINKRLPFGKWLANRAKMEQLVDRGPGDDDDQPSASDMQQAFAAAQGMMAGMMAGRGAGSTPRVPEPGSAFVPGGAKFLERDFPEGG